MPIKNSNEILVRGSLQNVSQAYRNQEYVADKIFPIIDGITRKTQILKYNKGAWFRDEAAPRGPGAAAPLVQYNISTKNVDPINYAAAAKVTDEERQDAKAPGANPIEPDMDAIELIAEKLDLKKEKRTADLLWNTTWADGTGSGGEDAGGLWGTATAANDTFLADIWSARNTIRKKTGKIANTLFLDYEAWSGLEIAPALVALLYPQGVKKNAPLIDVDSLKTLARVNEIIIGWSIEDTSIETVADADSGFTAKDIWGVQSGAGLGVAALYYRPARPGKKVASPGYQYRLRQDTGGFRKSTKWRNAAEHSDYYDTQEELDITPVGTDLLYMWKNTAKAA
jgi:hypothetical protein